MISIDRAKEQMFRKSTPAELRDYCRIEGIKTHPRHSEQTLVSMLCKHFNMTTDPTSNVAHVLDKIKPKSTVTPPMNLDPEGVWGGRRMRGRLRRPQNEMYKRDAGLYVFANGSYGGTKEGYGIKFDEVQVIPQPIYERLKEIEITRHKTENVKVVIDDVEHNNKVLTFEHDKMYHLDYEVEEGTEHLPGSMLEWYQGHDPKWYMGLDLREMQLIAKKLGLETHDYNDRGTKKSVVIPLEALRGNVFTFVFGFAELDLEEQAA
jgi:hypothetical protein